MKVEERDANLSDEVVTEAHFLQLCQRNVARVWFES